MHEMKRFFSWCVNTTFLVVIMFLISIHLGLGERGSYVNALLSLMFVMAYSVTRGKGISEVWVTASITSAFAAVSAGATITLVGVVTKQTYLNYNFIVGIFAACMAFCAIICMFFFAFVTSTQLKVSYQRVSSAFCLQAIVFYLVFSKGAEIMQKLFSP